MEQFDKEKYRKLIWALTVSKDISNEIHAYKRIIDVGMKVLLDHKKQISLSETDNDGHLSVQMSILKSISLLKLSSGLRYANKLNDTHLNDIFDPFGMGNIVRSQYESFCNFNNIYIQSSNQDTIAVKYYMWVLAGLNSRQRFPALSKDAIEQREKEAKIILQHIDCLHQNTCYTDLTERGKTNLERCISKREWQIKIESNNAYKIAWHEMFSNAGVKHFDEYYNYLSSVSHPSNLSVIQFKSMYEGQEFTERPDFNTMRTMLSTSKTIISFLIRDYIAYFKLNDEFEQLPLIDQMLVNTYNRNFRGEDYMINNCLQLLN